MMKIGFIGLGVMGGHMARHLATAGHEVTVYNRTIAKAEAWTKANGGKLAATPRDLAKGQDIVMACVGNDADLLGVTTGSEGAFQAMAPGALFVDHTTASADVARRLHADARARNIGFVDAPVSGGEAGARDGTLTVMCGGDAKDYARVEGAIAAFARACRLMGPSGAGQLTKMANQICIAGLVQALSEGIHFSQSAGLDVEAMLDVVSQGAAGSWQMNNRGATMNRGEFDFGFAVRLMRKDLGICLAEARRNGAKLPVTALVDQFYGDVDAAGGGGWDTSSLITRLSVARQEK
ncbi:NAD(P)-dependent oxidoreductase [Paracoccus onubensis]|uniref:NAD(P)-dependent oxidoreductase n=1 Tax=Paracoccus onubensis TaxID=1675788 RepID=UPI00272F7393|nr:NAD(P)-dependent oxidoreductase [Paracoccus onubensis]MDP0926464.1 NAD(P)-dependent oxidoreductase [Paracoccus onubensis]